MKKTMLQSIRSVLRPFGALPRQAGLPREENDSHCNNEAGQQHLEVDACRVPDLHKSKQAVMTDEQDVGGTIPAEVDHLERKGRRRLQTIMMNSNFRSDPVRPGHEEAMMISSMWTHRAATTALLCIPVASLPSASGLGARVESVASRSVLWISQWEHGWYMYSNRTHCI